jgi:hypothetical protein
MRMLAMPEAVEGSLMSLLMSLKAKLIKIGAKVVSHGRYLVFQLARSPTANVPGHAAGHRRTAAATGANVRKFRDDVRKQGDGRRVL